MSTSADTPDVYIVLDTETTGLDHRTEKLIEIAAVKMRGDTVEETFTSLVNPKKPIRHSSFLIHGIPDEVVAEAPPIEDVLPRFLEFVGDLPYVAHNALFDYSFINEAHKEVYDGEKFRNVRIDTFEMYRSVFPEEASHGLSSLLARFGLNSEVKHRALDDALGLASVYPRLNELYQQKYNWQLSQTRNIQYLMERYLRLQKTVQILHAEMSDLKDVFKMYFQQGGRKVEVSTGESMISSYRRTYSYDEKRVWEIAKEADICERLFKLNPRAADKLIDRKDTDPELKGLLIDARVSMNENRGVHFAKPQLTPELDEESEDTAEASVEV